VCDRFPCHFGHCLYHSTILTRPFFMRHPNSEANNAAQHLQRDLIHCCSKDKSSKEHSEGARLHLGNISSSQEKCCNCKHSFCRLISHWNFC
jgi:hypothetical protein